VSALLRHRDRGGIAPVVAALLSSGVLLGLAALVIDVGNMYAEHEQLQTGADAAAIRVAQVCAGSVADCTVPDAEVLAGRYARDNARNGEAGARVCGRGGELPECRVPSGPQRACVLPAPDTGDYVEIRTHTLRPDGSTLLPPVFADAVIDGFDGAAVTACARAAWGAPASARGLAMTISICDWSRYTGNGATYPAVEQAIAVYDETAPTACAIAGASPGNRGGFRWLAGADRGCRTAVSVAASYEAAAGDSVPGRCPDALTRLVEEPAPVLVPVFNAVTVQGGGSVRYTVRGIAAFVLTGWRLPGSQRPSPTRSTCDAGATACVFGYFARGLVPGGGTLGGPDLGAHVVVPIG
jgi:hypothetical protein